MPSEVAMASSASQDQAIDWVDRGLEGIESGWRGRVWGG